jgi:hypothetical protein
MLSEHLPQKLLKVKMSFIILSMRILIFFFHHSKTKVRRVKMCIEKGFVISRTPK